MTEWSRGPVATEDWIRSGDAPAAAWTRVPIVIAINLTRPIITGSPVVGQTLSLSNGLWLNAPSSYAYAWLRDGVAIPGETASTYIASPDDVGAVITGRVTAINRMGSSLPATSLPAPAIVHGQTFSLNFLTQTYIGATPVCSRASVGYAETAAGLLQSFPANTFRITDKGLLKPEPASTNIFLWSGDASNAAWARSSVSVTANAATGVLGTATATKIASSSAASIQHSHQQGLFSVTNNGTVTQWRVLKKAELSWVYLALYNSGVYTGAYFDLDAGVVGTVESGVTASIHAMANGWYLCAITKTISGPQVYGSLVLTNADNSGATVTLSVGQGVYQDIGQLEDRQNATTYIATTSAAATRAAETISIGLPIYTGSLTYTVDDDTTKLVPLLPDLASYLTPTDIALNGRSYIETLVGRSDNVIDWFPEGASLHVDLENSHFYWNDSIRTLADLTDNGDGSYDLRNVNSFLAAGEATAVVDYTYAADYVANVPSGTLFSWTDGSQRVEVFVYNISAAAKLTRFVIPGPTFAAPRYSHPDDLGSVDGKGRRRVQVALKGGQKVRSMVDNYIMSTDPGLDISTLTLPTRISFGRNARFQNDPLTNGTLHRVTIFPTARTEAQMDAHAVDGVARAYHWLGDSFLNLQKLKEQLMLLHAADGYIGTSQDGIGGTSITQQAVRFLSQYAPKWRDTPWVFVMDGGPDGTWQEGYDALDVIEAATGDPGRVLYIQGSPAQNLPGSPGRASYDDYMEHMRTRLGSRFIETLGPVTNTNPLLGPVYINLSPTTPSEVTERDNDLADIANNIWPRSLLADTIHPDIILNSAGYSGDSALADITYRAAVALGALP